MVSFLVAALMIGSLVVGLSIYFTKNPVRSSTKEPPVKEAVLVLSTYMAYNLPLVVGFHGEAFFRLEDSPRQHFQVQLTIV